MCAYESCYKYANEGFCSQFAHHIFKGAQFGQFSPAHLFWLNTCVFKWTNGRWTRWTHRFLCAGHRRSLASWGEGKFRVPRGLSVQQHCNLKCGHLLLTSKLQNSTNNTLNLAPGSFLCRSRQDSHRREAAVSGRLAKPSKMLRNEFHQWPLWKILAQQLLISVLISVKRKRVSEDKTLTFFLSSVCASTFS